MKQLIVTALACFIGTSLFAQNIEFKSANFKDDKEGLKTATTAIKEADEIFELGHQAVFETKDPGLHFKKALVKYTIAQDFNPNNGMNNYKMGVCYAYSTDPQKSISYIEKAKELDPECSPFLDYYYGYALQLKGNYSEAIKSFQTFKESYKKADNFGKFVTQHINECKSARSAQENPVRAWVDNVSEVNSEYDDYAPSITTDGGELIFTSNRPNNHTPDEVGEYDDDIYTSYSSNMKWSAPKSLPGGVNTDVDDVSNNLSYDGTKMLLHRDNDGQTDIFESELKGLEWGEPKQMHYNISNKKSDEKYASYSPRGWSIYFARSIESRSSGYDIFNSAMQSQITKDYKSATIMSEVNTAFDDGPIYMHIDDETMYICAQGNGSLGGYDIFVSKKVSGVWTKPVNLGYPINTQYDDFFFASTANGKYAYIASNRDGGKGGYDIYKVTYWGEPKQPVLDMEDYLLASIVMPIKDSQVEEKVDVNRKSFTVFRGKTIDAMTKKAVEATIEITDNSTGKIIETVTTNSATGKFIITLPSGKNYGIAVKADGYLFHSENFDIPNGAADNLVDKVIELKNIKIGSKIALRNIFFDTGKSTLRSESNAELDRLVKLMNDVPNLKIEISGHTDNTGSAKLNNQLSKDRAEAVVNYLASKGISKARMTSAGYGSTKPIASNETAQGRQENRRTEFEIKGN